MRAYVALLRAVNVGGTGKLPMADLVALCAAAGFADARTYIASGNALFRSDGTEQQVRRALEERLETYAGKPVGVLVRTGEELARIVAANPFAGAQDSRVAALFTDEALGHDPLAGAAGHADEEVRTGERVLYIHYPSGMARTKLRLPAQRTGTARNMNTVAKLAELAAALD